MKKFKNFLITVLVTTILTSIFQGILTPVWTNIRIVLLKIATFGSKQYSDMLYISIAKGLHESSGLGLYVFTILFIMGFISGLVSAIFSKLFLNSEEPQKDIKSLKSEFKRFIVATAIFFIFLGMTFIKEIYVNGAITNYNQLYSITCPYITQNDRLIIQSEFSQIQNRNDYVNVINKLKNVADKYKLKYPSFIIF